MGVEIERKFLVKDYSFKSMARCHCRIKQGYLCREPDRTVRIRVRDDEGYITVKDKNKGIERLEFEYLIPKCDAEEMLQLCEGRILDKTRYIVDYEGYTWEIDEFHNLETPLTIAEIELPAEETEFLLPAFIGEEVTGNPRYYNSML